MTSKLPLSVTHPHIADEWHPVNNGALTPEIITAGSGRVVWWLGKCGHEWDVKVCIRTGQNQGCPICSNKRILIGFNDLATTDPELIKEWHPVKNGSLLPTMFVRGNNKKVWWLGKCGHEWETPILYRTKSNSGCPYCAGQKILIGFNDLATTHPGLVELIHPTKNNGLDPLTLHSGSKKKVHWICPKNHEWSSPISWQSIKDGLYCSLCAGRNLEIGVNDFETMNPELAKEWNPTKNGKLLPSQMRMASHRKVWWLGECGHEWQAVIKNRTGKAKTGCPDCEKKRYVSKAEYSITEFIESMGLTVKQSDRKVLGGTEIDIYIPEKSFGIEYNGLYWHSEKMGKGRNYHYDKWLKAKNAGIQLLQIWEDEWITNPERIKNILRHKLGLNNGVKVFARKTSPVTLDYTDAKVFLDKYHIQGVASASYYYGLKDLNGSIVAVLAVKKEDKGATFNIVRYATSVTVVGGFTKLLKFVENNHIFDKFITFSDHCISDGGLYANNGFIADRFVRPDYRYVVGSTRAHKFGYRLKRFRNDPNLLWREGLSERELAELNNIPRIWDAGKTRWVKKIS